MEDTYMGKITRPTIENILEDFERLAESIDAPKGYDFGNAELRTRHLIAESIQTEVDIIRAKIIHTSKEETPDYLPTNLDYEDGC